LPQLYGSKHFDSVALIPQFHSIEIEGFFMVNRCLLGSLNAEFKAGISRAFHVFIDLGKQVICNKIC